MAKIALFLLLIWPYLGAQADPLPLVEVIKGAPQGYFPKGIAEAQKSVLNQNPAEAIKRIDATVSGWKHPLYMERTLLLKGIAQAELGELGAARESFETANKIKPSDSDIIVALASLLTAPEELERKSALLSDALWFNRFTLVQPIQAMNALADSFLAANNSAQATASFEKAVASNPEFAAARQKLAELYLASGRKPDALAQLRAAHATEPENKSIKVALAKTLLSGANRQFDSADIQEARRLAESSLSENLADEASLVLIRSLMETGDLDTAQTKLALAAKQSPQDANVLRLESQFKSEQQAQIAQAAKEPTPVSR